MIQGYKEIWVVDLSNIMHPQGKRPMVGLEVSQRVIRLGPEEKLRDRTR